VAEEERVEGAGRGSLGGQGGGATLTARPGSEGGLDIEVSFPGLPATVGIQNAGGMTVREPAVQR